MRGLDEVANHQTDVERIKTMAYPGDRNRPVYDRAACGRMLR